MSDYICPRCGAKLSRAKTAVGKHVYLICLTMNCTYSGTVPEYDARETIEPLRAEVARLTAERDAAIAETETFREVLVDNEAYGLQVIRERDAARADADRLAGLAANVVECYFNHHKYGDGAEFEAHKALREALDEHQRGEG